MKKKLKYILILFLKKNIPNELIYYILNTYFNYLLIPNYKRNELELLMNNTRILRKYKNKYIILESKLRNWKPISIIPTDYYFENVRIISDSIQYFEKCQVNLLNPQLLFNIKKLYRNIPSYYKNYYIYKNTILNENKINYEIYILSNNNLKHLNCSYFEIYLLKINNLFDFVLINNKLIKIYIDNIDIDNHNPVHSNHNKLNLENSIIGNILKNPYYIKNYLHVLY